MDDSAIVYRSRSYMRSKFAYGAITSQRRTILLAFMVTSSQGLYQRFRCTIPFASSLISTDFSRRTVKTCCGNMLHVRASHVQSLKNYRLQTVRNKHRHDRACIVHLQSIFDACSDLFVSILQYTAEYQDSMSRNLASKNQLTKGAESTKMCQ